MYWISVPTSRHGEELNLNHKVAVAIPVEFSSDKKVVGLQIEGVASEVTDKQRIQEMIKLYSDKFDRGEEWYQDFMSGKNENRLYCLKPQLVILFDANLPASAARKEWKIAI